jgi:peptidoglycan/xylan/chitin deacetylase (PgdA/CDA1 family)
MTGRRGAAWAAAAAFVASGGAAIARRRRAWRGDHRVFVLEYHDVCGDGPEPEGSVAAARFRRHLRFLKRHMRFVSLGEAAARLAARRPLGEDLAVVTLDDGYAGNWEHAWPVLRDERVPAAVFVTTGFLDGAELWFDTAERCFARAAGADASAGRVADAELAAAIDRWRRPAEHARVKAWLKGLPRARRDALLAELRTAFPPLAPAARPLAWAQVRALHQAGVEIGCHTVTHPIMSTLPAPEQEAEVVRARDRIAAETGEVPRLFAYPNGAASDFTDETVRVLAAAGFVAACTTVRGSNRPGCDLLRLARIGVGAEPCIVLAARLAGALDDDVRARFGLKVARAAG